MEARGGVRVGARAAARVRVRRNGAHAELGAAGVGEHAVRPGAVDVRAFVRAAIDLGKTAARGGGPRARGS